MEWWTGNVEGCTSNSISPVRVSIIREFVACQLRICSEHICTSIIQRQQWKWWQLTRDAAIPISQALRGDDNQACQHDTIEWLQKQACSYRQQTSPAKCLVIHTCITVQKCHGSHQKCHRSRGTRKGKTNNIQCIGTRNKELERMNKGIHAWGGMNGW